MLQEKAFKDLFEGFNHTKIGVIGDIMLDTYWWGNVDRISPEAPVPIVNLKRKELRVGGAANVALNLRALGAPTTVFAVIGNDLEGKDLKGLLEAEGIQTKYIHTSTDRVTTNKVRVMGRNQQMMRLDHEHTTDLSEAETTTNGIGVVPLSIRFGDEEFIDREELSVEAFYDKMASTGLLPENRCTFARSFRASLPRRRCSRSERSGVHQPLRRTLCDRAIGTKRCDRRRWRHRCSRDRQSITHRRTRHHGA